MAVRPERLPAEQIRQRMLDAGRELALEVGASLTIERLRLEEVIQRARVPRSSVYRIWPYREDYIDDLLCYLAGAGSWFSDRTVLDPETFEVARQIIVGNSHLLAAPEGRRALIREVLRVTTTGNYRTLSESAPWRLHMALVATLGSTRSGEARERIAAALEDSQRRSRDSLVTVFDILAKVLGLRLRDPAWSASHLQLAGGLLVQAMALRNLQVRAALGAESGGPDGDSAAGADNTADGTADGTAHGTAEATADAALVDALLNQPLPGPGLNGEPAPWTLAAFAYVGLFEAFVELDPDFVPPEELTPRK
jgi:AcrR family transcriptional regulator